jgi:hydroxymethylglutaryl-CoA reductase
MNAFLRTEKPLRPNTGNPLMEETPPAAKLKDYETAVKDVALAIQELFHAFEQNPTLEISNPFFGDLNFELTIQLLYKHSTHHLRQFGVENI